MRNLYIFFSLYLFILTVTNPVLANEQNCTDPYILCSTDILSAKLLSITVAPQSQDKGWGSTPTMELNTYIELGIPRDFRSKILAWSGEDFELAANLGTSAVTHTYAQKRVSQLAGTIELYNPKNKPSLNNFYSKINLYVKERGLLKPYTFCSIPFSHPDKQNPHLYSDFLSMVVSANLKQEDRKAEREIDIDCKTDNGSANLKFKFLFEFERQDIIE